MNHSDLESNSSRQDWEDNIELCRNVYRAYVDQRLAMQAGRRSDESGDGNGGGIENPRLAGATGVASVSTSNTSGAGGSGSAGGGGGGGGKSRDDVWEKHIRDLREFKQKNGHCRVPRHYHENPKLGRWVMNVRSHYHLIQKGKRSSLINDRRLEQLRGLDFDFSPKKKSHTQYYVDRWAQHMDELRAFKRQNGHCRVPQRFPENKKLGGWVLYVRHQHRKYQLGQPSTMTQERVQQLEELGFDFAPRKGRPASSDSDSIEGNDADTQSVAKAPPKAETDGD